MKKEILNAIVPYNCTVTNGQINFTSECNKQICVRIKRESDFFGLSLNGYSIITLSFESSVLSTVQNPGRLSYTISELTSKILTKEPNNIIHYICSHKGYKLGQANNYKFSGMRLRLFRRWHYIYSKVFSDIKHYIVNTEPTEENKEPIEMGFLYHSTCSNFKEIEENLDLLIAAEIPDKPVIKAEL